MTLTIPWPVLWAIAGALVLLVVMVVEMDRPTLTLREWGVLAFFIAVWPLGLLFWGVGRRVFQSPPKKGVSLRGR